MPNATGLWDEKADDQSIYSTSIYITAYIYSSAGEQASDVIRLCVSHYTCPAPTPIRTNDRPKRLYKMQPIIESAR